MSSRIDGALAGAPRAKRGVTTGHWCMQWIAVGDRLLLEKGWRDPKLSFLEAVGPRK